jgi:hypothetical protein
MILDPYENSMTSYLPDEQSRSAKILTKFRSLNELQQARAAQHGLKKKQKESQTRNDGSAKNLYHQQQLRASRFNKTISDNMNHAINS